MYEFDRNHDADADDAAGNGPIVLTSRTQLWRDCLVECLEFESYAVLPFPTLASWLDVRSKYPSPSIVLVCAPDQKELMLVEKIAKEETTILVADDTGANLAQMLSNGIRGIIPTTTSFNVALSAIRLVQSGGTFVPADLLAIKENRGDFGQLLTDRQIDVVEALRQGKANKQIARDLHLRESTVKVHIRQIMRKLDARNRTEIAVLASELLELNRREG